MSLEPRLYQFHRDLGLTRLTEAIETKDGVGSTPGTGVSSLETVIKITLFDIKNTYLSR